ncbi:MAG: nucleoside hydrolase [Oscillospiraceae bacterium]|nr:nucleoside hydrolase [Oscillospiraceae bacterium]
MSKIPVMIDCDPGKDDSIAIIMLAGSGKVDIKAITTTHGNVGLEGTTRNALALKDYLGLDCVVAKGAAKPMIVPLKDASTVHGLNGLGDYELPPAVSVPEKDAAWDVMYRLAKESNGEMVLVVLGPMTNAALTILKYPDFKNYVKGIYMMGGSRNWGNHSQNAEFNIWGDPHACQVVLSSGIPITMADMAFGGQNGFTGEEITEMYSHAKKLKPMLTQFQEHDKIWLKSERDRLGKEFNYDTEITTIYDSTAAIALLEDGESLVTEEYYVVCETQGTETEGQTIFDYKGQYGKAPNVRLTISVDRERYKDAFRKAFAHFE